MAVLGVSEKREESQGHTPEAPPGVRTGPWTDQAPAQQERKAHSFTGHIRILSKRVGVTGPVGRVAATGLNMGDASVGQLCVWKTQNQELGNRHGM